MTNGDKYKSAKERGAAFMLFCQKFMRCEECPAFRLSSAENNYCRFDWLEIEAEEEKMTAEEVANILAEHNKWCRGAGICAPHTPKELSKAFDRAVEILRSVKDDGND